MPNPRRPYPTDLTDAEWALLKPLIPVSKDGAKKVLGVKRHLVVDTLGIVLGACVSPAGADDRDGAMVVLSRSIGRFPRLHHVWADQGCRGARFIGWAGEALGVTVQIVVRRDGGRYGCTRRRCSPKTCLRPR